MHLKVALLVLLALRLVRVLDDRLLAVDLALLQLVAEHALDRLAFVRVGNLVHCLGDGVVVRARLQQTERRLTGPVGGQHGVGLAAGHLVGGCGAGNGRMRGHRDETVNVSAQVTRGVCRK